MQTKKQLYTQCLWRRLPTPLDRLRRGNGYYWLIYFKTDYPPWPERDISKDTGTTGYPYHERYARLYLASLRQRPSPYRIQWQRGSANPVYTQPCLSEWSGHCSERHWRGWENMDGKQWRNTKSGIKSAKETGNHSHSRLPEVRSGNLYFGFPQQREWSLDLQWPRTIPL